MYTEAQLKSLLKKSCKFQNLLNNRIEACNKVLHTEQNEEEIQNVQEFLGRKKALVSKIRDVLTNYFLTKKAYSIETVSAEIFNLTNQYNALCEDHYLSRLEEIYTRKSNIETMFL